MTITLPVSAVPEIERRHGRPTHLAQLLLRAAEWRPQGGLLLLSPDDLARAPAEKSYAQLFDEARRILGGLRARGRTPGTKILLVLERAGDILPAFWASVLGGYVPCVVAPIRNDPQRWAAYLAHIGALLDRPLAIVARADEAPGVEVIELDALRASPPADEVHIAQTEECRAARAHGGFDGRVKGRSAHLLIDVAGLVCLIGEALAAVIGLADQPPEIVIGETPGLGLGVFDAEPVAEQII
jgi:hypothetical protein